MVRDTEATLNTHLDARERPHLDARERRRLAADARFMDQVEKRETEADTMIGELVRDGKTICYVWPPSGRYREGSRLDLIRFLLRNNYA